VYLGGEWITGIYSFTNFDGMGADNIDVVVFWEQSNDADGNLDNSTCGEEADVSVNCVDQGAAVSGVYFQENANDFRMSKGSNYNVQVPYCLCHFSPPTFQSIDFLNDISSI
jgi:hypothetical protein